MIIDLTAKQVEFRASARAFAEVEIAPYADSYDHKQEIPKELIQRLAKAGYLGTLIPREYGGSEVDMICFGLLNEEIGRACSSVRSLITVHGMVSYALIKWGSKDQKDKWLPQLSSGKVIGAFALTEPSVGSDAKSIETKAINFQDSYILNGIKKWITYGQIADLFLVFGKDEDRNTAFLVERESTGLTILPISEMLGTKASMLAELTFQDCKIPADNLVGGPGFGLNAIAGSALDIGRYSIAWGCVGLAQACLDASIDYSSNRMQFGSYIKDHQLIQRMIADMVTNIQAARLLCHNAGRLKDIGNPSTIIETCVAKYFASTMCTKAASDAVQIFGANGCSGEYPVQRYFRDAKIMEIIEGSTQIQQILIAKQAYQNSFSK